MVLVIVALLLGGGAGLMLNPDLRRAVGVGSQPSTGPSPVTSPTPSPSPSPTTPGIGSAVRDGTFQFVVTSVDCGHNQVGEPPFKVKADGQFCLVGITVTNIGQLAAVLLDSAQYAYTDGGHDDDGVSDNHRYGTNSGAGVLANRGITVWVNLIQPGKSVSGTLVFDIPRDATITRLELHDSAFSDGVVVTV